MGRMASLRNLDGFASFSIKSSGYLPSRSIRSGFPNEAR